MNKTITLYTIGFTKKSASQFFELLEKRAVKKVLDTRLNNVSQLAGFTKRDDLAFFLQRVAGIGYQHTRELAPTEDMLKSYKKGLVDWESYARSYSSLIEHRRVENIFSPESLDGACFLCSEALPHHCHRRLAAEFLKHHIGERLNIVHL